MDCNGMNITFHPALTARVEAEIELGEERNRAAAVLGPDTFERVRAIIGEQPAEKRTAFYGTIAEAACAGEDFSRVESLTDIGGVYARFIVRRVLGE